MSKFTETLKLVAALLPVAKSLLETAEGIFGAGKGADKLKWVQDALHAAYTAIDNGKALFESAWPAIKAFINATVATYNALGRFKKA